MIKKSLNIHSRQNKLPYKLEIEENIINLTLGTYRKCAHLLGLHDHEEHGFII